MAGAGEGVGIRAYRPEDRDGFARLVSRVLGEFGFTVDPILDSDLEDPQGSYEGLWIATDGAEIVGSVAIRLVDDGHAAELKRMYLRPDHRGLGHGRRLLDEAIGWAANHHCRAVVLDTSAAMTAAQQLYRSAGFVPTGTRTETGARDRRCEILYRLELSGPV